jgi:Ca2+-binding EF-hand superfamily protein
MDFALKRDAIERDRTSVFSKDIVTKNPLFSVEEIRIFFELFNSYANERREVNMKDLMATAKTLGFEKRHPVVYEAISQIAKDTEGMWIRFEEFLTRLTQKLVLTA